MINKRATEYFIGQTEKFIKACGKKVNNTVKEYLQIILIIKKWKEYGKKEKDFKTNLDNEYNIVINQSIFLNLTFILIIFLFILSYY
jgi:hypothetical protein